MTDPKHLQIARKHLGIKELTNKNDGKQLLTWWERLNSRWLYLQPWCGLFVAICLREAGYPIAKYFYRAKDWLNYGYKISMPVVGCIVIFDRKGGGHVGFCIGKDNAGRLLVLGGNQGNQVSIMPFDMNRVLGYRMPKEAIAPYTPLPIITSQGASSQDEA